MSRISFAVLSEYITAGEDERAAYGSSITRASDRQIYQARGDVVTWVSWQSDVVHEPNAVHTLEIYARAKAYAEARDDTVRSKLCDTAGGAESAAVVEHARTLLMSAEMAQEEIEATKERNASLSGLEAGSFCLHRKPAFDCGDDNDDAVVLSIRLSFKDDDAGRQTRQLLSEFGERGLVDGKIGLISSIVVDGGFETVRPRDDNSDAGSDWPTLFIGVFASSKMCAAALTNEFVSSLQSGLAHDGKSWLTVVGSTLTLKLQERLSAIRNEAADLNVFKQAPLAGYVLHPGLCVGDIDVTLAEANVLKAKAAPSASSAAASTAASGDDGEEMPFHMKFSSDGKEPRAIVFTGGADWLSGAARVTAENQLRIPLLELLRKLCGRGAQEEEVNAQLVFTQLGRLRGIRDDIDCLNEYHAGEIDHAAIDDALLHRVSCILENLSAFGYQLPNKSTTVLVRGLHELVKLVEDSFVHVVARNRESIREDATIEYIALMEYYHINDIVVAPASILGGAPVAYRICDVYFESIRSVFGGKKLSFHLALECICNLGTSFAFVSFEEVFGDWEGVQQLKNLPYRQANDASELKEIQERGALLHSVGLQPAYREYRSSCFFAHGSTGKGMGSGGSTAITSQLTSSGRMMVDTTRGIALGHHIAPGNDPVCLAVQATVKSLKTVQRAQAEGESGTKMAERLKSAGLRLIQKIPSGLFYMCWPALVGFGLSVKRWGHVLVSGLTPVKPDPMAWDKLVLPAAKKELLLSLVESAFDKKAPRLKDLVDSKGGGSLFLLHGVPGTGKTLTVQALAERFGVPAYYLTFGELGTSVKELEATMSEVLSLCSAWGALVLLDEGDALVERREKGALLLNSMTGVLLSNLDAFSGLLFITTNRVASFDPAALSRVTLAIRYGSLKNSGRREVWRNVLERASCDISEFDLDALARRGGSGRDINSAARLALNLAYHRRAKISQSLLMEVLDIADDFRRDFMGGLAAHEDAGRISDDEDAK